MLLAKNKGMIIMVQTNFIYTDLAYRWTHIVLLNILAFHWSWKGLKLFFCEGNTNLSRDLQIIFFS